MLLFYNLSSILQKLELFSRKKIEQ